MSNLKDDPKGILHLLIFNRENKPAPLFSKLRRPLLLSTALAGYAAVFLIPSYAQGVLHVPSPATAANYAQVAALNLAHRVNAARIQVAPRSLTRHDRRILAHETRQAAHEAHLAQRQSARQQKLLLHRQNEETRLAEERKSAQQRVAKLTVQHQALTSGNVVLAAYSLRGTRYVFGGTSRSGFDCSGFVRYILGTTGGVSLPRTAVEQYWHGTPVATDQLQPGDLVFFKNTYKRGISHVGIYAGDGKFIHAANAHKGVRMDNLTDTYFAHHFAGARRVLPDQMRAAAGLH